MKQIIVLFSFFIFSTTLLAQEKTRKLENYNEIRVGDGVIVQLYRGEAPSATVAVSTGSETDVRTYVENGILRVNWKKNVDNNNRTATIDVYYTKLSAVKANGGAKIKSNQSLKAKELMMSATGGGKIDLELDCTNLNAECNAGSTIKLSGESSSQNVEVSSGGKYDAKDLVTETTNIEASSGGSAEVNVTNSINAEASTGASIKYTGNPQNREIESNKFSGGQVKSF